MKRKIKTRLVFEITQRMGDKIVGHFLAEESKRCSSLLLQEMFHHEVSSAQDKGATNMLVLNNEFTFLCQGKECKVTLNRVTV